MIILVFDHWDHLCITLGVILVLGIASWALTVHILRMKKKNKMFVDIEKFLSEYVKRDQQNSKWEKAYREDYDYILQTKNEVIYIMLVPNFTEGEIVLNSPTKWQYRKTYKDESVRFVSRVEKLMRFDPPQNSLPSRRLYIIYPNSGSLLRTINECEMEFVRPTTDVNGTNIITYHEMIEHKESIEL